MATYYVRTDGNDANAGTADSAAGAFLTWGRAGSEHVDNDIVYVKSGTYNLTNTVVNTAGGPVSIATAIQVRWEGYEATAGDRCPTNDRPILHANGQVPTQMFLMNGDFDDHSSLHNLLIDGNSQLTNGIVGPANGFRSCTVVNCIVQHCDGSVAFSLVNAISCKAFSNAAIGFNSCNSQLCWADTNEDGFDGGSEAHLCSYCIASNNSAIGFDSGSYARYLNCVSYNNTSDGFEGGFCETYVNCISVGDNAFAFDTTTHNGLVNCAHFDATSGRTDATPVFDIGPITLTADPFTNAAGGDFSLNNTAGGGALLRAAGFSPYGQTGYIDVGAVQHQDAMPLILTRRNTLIGR